MTEPRRGLPPDFPRRLVRALMGLVLLLLAWVGVYSIAAGGKEYPVTGHPARRTGVRGAFHVHGEASHDADAPLEEIASAAREVGLDFVVMTDHNRESVPDPAYVGGVLFVHGVELTTPWGHLVALGVPRGLTEDERQRDPIRTIHQLGGHAFLAHPIQERNGWRDWDAGRAADGLELYSGDSFFRAAPVANLACAAGAYFAKPLHAAMVLVRPDEAARRKLLDISADRPKAALCAHDAHGFPSYRLAFAAMATYLPGVELNDDARESARRVVEAIGEGRSLCVFDPLGDPAGFGLEGLDGGRELPVGGTFKVSLPRTKDARWRVVVAGSGELADDGVTVRAAREGPMHVEVQIEAPGCIVRPEWRPWIVPGVVMATPR